MTRQELTHDRTANVGGTAKTRKNPIKARIGQIGSAFRPEYESKIHHVGGDKTTQAGINPEERGSITTMHIMNRLLRNHAITYGLTVISTPNATAPV